MVELAAAAAYNPPWRSASGAWGASAGRNPYPHQGVTTMRCTLRRGLLALAAGLAVLGWIGATSVAAEKADDDGFVNLFNNKDFEGFDFVPAKPDPAKTWS